MADEPPRPRPRGLPPRIPTEAFRLADTPPGGTPTSTLVGMPRPSLTPVSPVDPPSGPYELAGLIRGLRQELIILRESLPPTAPTVLVTPSTPPPPSKGKVAAQVAGKVVGRGSQWLAIAIGALGIAGQIAHIYRPDIEGPIQMAIKLLGGTP